MTNFMLDKPFQFIFKWRYYDMRESEWSVPSTTYFQSSQGCDATAAFSRCLKMRLPIGGPLVDQLLVGMSNDGINWYQVDVIDKYRKYNDSQEKWYQRGLAQLPGYSDTDCSFDYTFCNDRQKIPIDPTDVSRAINPIPRDAQGLIPVKEGIGVYNYNLGNCPIDRKEIDKFTVDKSCTQSKCVPEYVTVKVRAVIYALNQFGNGFVFQLKSEEEENTNPVYFGSRHLDDSNSYGQQFSNPTKNFIAYVEGTDYWAEMKQWTASTGFINRTEVGVREIELAADVDDIQIDLANSGKYFYQEAIIRVPKGTKGFIRLVSHGQTNGFGSSQDTSTTVGAVMNIVNFSNGSPSLPGANIKVKEVYFDTCNGDQELQDAFVIYDQSEFGDQGRANIGYVKDENDRPVEGVDVKAVSGGSPTGTYVYTDHNGFYHFITDSNVVDPVDIALLAEQDCDDFEVVRDENVTGAEGSVKQVDFVISALNYKGDWFLEVTVPVRDCDNNPVPGVRVSMSGSKWRISDNLGNAVFKVRNYVDRNRVLTATTSNNNLCYTVDCHGNCNPCAPSVLSSTPACFTGINGVPQKMTMATLFVNADANDSAKGLKSGGRYEIAVRVKGSCGRASAPYSVGFVNIPRTQDKGFLGFCGLSYNAPGMVLPEWGTCLEILRSENINNYELQWIVDKIERTSDSKIKLTIQSLYDYNLNYGFKTNTTYQWVKDDRVEFIANGDGTVFSSGNGLLNFLALSPFHDTVISQQEDAPADFFNQLLIQDDGRLADLKEGAIIEIQRPKPATEFRVFRSICAHIPIINGQLAQDAGTFDTFDTFVVNRVIPTKTGSVVAAFEHYSPSDFWGSARVSDAGKSYVENQFENEKRFGRSLALNSPTIFNRFDSTLVKTFDAPEQGDIIAMTISDGKVIHAVCENDNFVAQIADEFVRVGNDGVIRALPANSLVSDAQPKLYGKYGCKYDDVGSVYFGDGYTTWVDTNKGIINFDYQAAKNASISKTESYFRIKWQIKEKHNSNQTNPLSKYRWVVGMNWQTGELYYTIKTLRDASINNRHAHYERPNETIIYHPVLDEFLGSASYTPECYSQVDITDDSGCMFLSFSQGRPYVHPVITDRFNEFYGIACDEVIGISVNQHPEKVRLAQSMELQSEMLWFAEKVITDNPNFISEIPPIKWKRNNNKWNASFLYNKNSRAGLHGNGSDGVVQDSRGYYVGVTLVRDNTDQLKYGTIDNTKRVKYNELDLVFAKFQFIEQTGFVENR